MKLTESQIKNLINEEITKMIEEGELDEGFFDAIKGSASKVGRDITGAVKGAADAVKKYGSDVKRAGEISSIAADLDKLFFEIYEMHERIKKTLPVVANSDIGKYIHNTAFVIKKLARTLETQQRGK